MGSPYDFFGKQSWIIYDKLTKKQNIHRQLLQKVMLENGFRNFSKELWHITLKQEPYRIQYFDFDVK
jgi:D-alanyl-D-alanine dipeptidase